MSVVRYLVHVHNREGRKGREMKRETDRQRNGEVGSERKREREEDRDDGREVSDIAGAKVSTPPYDCR